MYYRDRIRYEPRTGAFVGPILRESWADGFCELGCYWECEHREVRAETYQPQIVTHVGPV